MMLDNNLFPSDDRKNSYLVLARKYRPQNFGDMIGQDVLVRTLYNAIKMNRVAHAFILTGIRGIGKTTAARIIAKALNCEQINDVKIEPCGTCSQCVSITQERNQDILEVDAASHTGVDDIREITENARYRPLNGRFKIYIIDEVHMLSTNAFNALLKTLEEPPEHVKFIFATTEIRKIPMTILSRCQRFDLKRVSVSDLTTHFTAILNKEGIKFEEQAVAMIAKVASGSVRDGLSILDQAISHTNGDITAAEVSNMLGLSSSKDLYVIYDAILKRNVNEALSYFKQMHSIDAILLLQDFLSLTHTLCKVKIDETLLEELDEVEQNYCRHIITSIDLLHLNRIWMALIKGYDEVKNSYNPIISMEMLLIRVCYISILQPPEQLIKQMHKDGLNNQNNEIITTKKEGDKQKFDFNSWDELVASMLKMDEMILYHHARNNMILENFAKGEISLFLLPNTNKSVIESLKSYLKKNSDMHWIIKVSDQMPSHDNKTLAQQTQDKVQLKAESIHNDAAVQSVLNAFDGLEIYEAKIK